ncbi:hypothetical protein [Halalkalicoccus sp. NIPERK01]|uniref:hypothetical protein n=1 Tax=Halalkalicoccus sp. NIPERK01 TaxID=3053469 RepID=UPI00256F61F2|nr:hypothetical protein [Halalkalicoccus sp. NIPERK01]MDL5361338.1 hypothetical protein [Halalkalicoccus sp. NIPERK01]
MPVDLYTDQWIREELLPRSEIGGGEGYEPANRVHRTDADVVVRTGDELADILDSRTEGVVWVPDDVELDLAPHTYHLRGETVLASDRGLDGSPGAKLFTREKGVRSHAWAGGGATGVFHVHDDARLTALRLIGPQIDYFDNPRMPGYIPFPPQDTYAERKAQVYSPNRARGMVVYDSGVEIDNIELAGWANQGMYLGAREWSAGTPSIHHIDGHNCMKTSAGYVIDVVRGHPTITDSYFNAARHPLCGFGHEDGGYTLENCLFGPTFSSHILDMHRVGNNMSGSDDPEHREWKYRAGGRIDVRRCTFVETHIPPASEGINFSPGRLNPVASIRGVPKEGVRIERCHIPHESPEDAFAQSGVPAAYQDENGYCNFSWTDNQYGMSRHYPGYGCELNLEDPMDGEPLLSAERREAYGDGIGRLRRTLGI